MLIELPFIQYHHICDYKSCISDIEQAYRTCGRSDAADAIEDCKFQSCHTDSSTVEPPNNDTLSLSSVERLSSFGGYFV